MNFQIIKRSEARFLGVVTLHCQTTEAPLQGEQKSSTAQLKGAKKSAIHYNYYKPLIPLKTMLKYNVISRKNPLTKEYAYHASLVPVIPIHLAELAQEVSDTCTLTIHDIKAVISALEERIYKYLRNGNSVRLGDLGSFHPTISSSGAATAEEFSDENIRGIKVRFVCSSKLRYEMGLKNPNMVLMRQQEQ